jgi:hypothetical protein
LTTVRIRNLPTIIYLDSIVNTTQATKDRIETQQRYYNFDHCIKQEGHHCASSFLELGVTHLMPDSCVGVLCGKNDIATPLENCAASITSVKIGVPKWEPLYPAMNTMENAKVVQTTMNKEEEVPTMTLVPQAIGTPLIKSPIKDASLIGIAMAVSLVHQ